METALTEQIAQMMERVRVLSHTTSRGVHPLILLSPDRLSEIESTNTPTSSQRDTTFH
jgi:hypothetical protein